jgi:hypothetical protein
MNTKYCAIASIILMAETTMCETWSVNGTEKADFNTVQGAIDAASNGNEIIVIPRTYIATGEYVIVGNWGYCP